MRIRWIVLVACLGLVNCTGSDGATSGTDGTDGTEGTGGTDGTEASSGTGSGTASGTTTATTSATSTATTGASTTATTSATTSATSTTGQPAEGTMTVLTYNVAGLPEGISGSNPTANHPQISPLLNQYDLALVQEDFTYHDLLEADATHPYQSEPKASGGGLDMGDGLNRFSQTEFTDFVREAWEECNGTFDSGSDCLTTKGFSVGEHELAPGVIVDIYNLHMDAGGGAADIAARQAQTQQLLQMITNRSAGKALIVAGDTNMGSDDEADVVTLLAGAALLDACRELSCGEESRIDRIMYRESATLSLTPMNWRVDDSFVDGNGDDLSDHEAIGTDFLWQTK